MGWIRLRSGKESGAGALFLISPGPLRLDHSGGSFIDEFSVGGGPERQLDLPLILARSFRFLSLYIPNQSDDPQHSNHQIRQVKLPPAMTVNGGNRIGVVIVVPALAMRQKPNDQIIAAVLFGVVIAVTPKVRYRVIEFQEQTDPPVDEDKEEADAVYDLVDLSTPSFLVGHVPDGSLPAPPSREHPFLPVFRGLLGRVQGELPLFL